MYIDFQGGGHVETCSGTRDREPTSVHAVENMEHAATDKGFTQHRAIEEPTVILEDPLFRTTKGFLQRSHPQQPPAKACRCWEALQQRSHNSTIEWVIPSTQAIRHWTTVPQSKQAPMVHTSVLRS
jgi:hypothetical protein